MDRHVVKVEGEQTVFTYAYLHAASDFALEQALNSEEGSFYNSLCSIVMNAFCLEAYLNHIGMEHFDDWDEWAASLIKLERVANEVGIKVDYGKRPFQSIKRTNKFRNMLAHGKTKVIPISYTTTKTSIKSKVKSPRTEWEKTCTKDNAKLFLDDLDEVIKMIHKGYNIQGAPFILAQQYFHRQIK